jgi:hypothetical protein
MDSAYRALVDFDRFSVTGAPRIFTAREANDLLPLLDPVVARMREAARPRPGATEIVQAFGRRLDISGGGRPDEHEAAAQRELAESAEELRETLDELAGLGVQVKDPLRGLLDFPSERNGEIVELCWLHGEPAVSHWHRIGEGFAGRRPFDDEERT